MKRSQPPTGAQPPADPIASARSISGQYRAMAISELQRANKTGRLDAQTVHATRASAAATLALNFHLIGMELARDAKATVDLGSLSVDDPSEPG